VKRVALATSEKNPLLTEDDRALVAPLASRNISAEPAIWTDSTFPWNSFDAVVMRSCWDYHLKPAQFLNWVAALAKSGVPLWNPPGMIRWNADKVYLRDLERRGVEIVPTLWPEQSVALSDELKRAEWSKAVVKPRISATAYRTQLISRHDAEQAQALFEELRRGPGAMVQMFVEEIATRGEWSVIFFQGEYSHAVIKRPKAGDFRVQNDFGGTSERAEPSAAVLAAATSAVQAAGQTPMYARVDGVESGGRFLLMELELIEPMLFLKSEAGAAELFADAIAKAVRAQ
jgi:glutathione synthase/RimK-type ligase-like ATP-grasp enzyme